MTANGDRLPPIRVLSVDDNAPLRASLRAIFQLEDDMELVGEAANGQEGLELAGRLLPDVVLLDIDMPVMNGLEAGRHVKRRWPQIKLVYFVAEAIWQSEALDLGADAFLLKETPIGAVIETIRRVTGRERPALSTTPEEAPPRLRASLQELRLAAAALERIAGWFDAQVGSAGAESELDEALTRRAGPELLQLLLDLVSEARQLGRGEAGVQAPPPRPASSPPAPKSSAGSPARPQRGELTLPLIEPRPQAEPERPRVPPTDEPAPRAEAAPAARLIHVSAYPINAFSTLTQFIEAVERLAGVQAIQSQRFHQQRLEATVDYSGDVPLDERLRELTQFRPSVTVGADDEIDFVLGD